MTNQSLCIVFNTESVVGKAAIKSAKSRYYKVHKLKYEKNFIKTKKLDDKISFYKEEIQFINKNKYERISLICNTINKNQNFDRENFINDVLAVILAFSEITNKSIDNRVTLVGTVESYDFLKLNNSNIEGKIYTNLLGKNANNVRMDGSITPIVKYLAVNLGHLNFKVNAALFAPIENLSPKNVINGYQSKSLIKLPIKELDITNSLDIFIDPSNIYMTGQLIKFDGGVSIW